MSQIYKKLELLYILKEIYKSDFDFDKKEIDYLDFLISKNTDKINIDIDLSSTFLNLKPLNSINRTISIAFQKGLDNSKLTFHFNHHNLVYKQDLRKKYQLLLLKMYEKNKSILRDSVFESLKIIMQNEYKELIINLYFGKI